ncbi:M56 family metallopeptidase [Actinomadura sp. HBU206391]|uniref:M56 family metallopeptidase n=1 Tax=Actinomadura sp. HBU206391 TaxID=2731692 RepID=UPI00165037AE|nr:M56 family metallopeptidase [Actinomadura sp. HBU206391]MBC6460165.1 M56 family metallopeptidase [Actinomadura sp. HBU206391]
MFLVVAAGLIASVVALGCAAGPVLDRAGWPVARPAIAVACWIAALSGTFAGFAGAFAVALLRSPAPGHGVLEWLHNCVPGHRHSGVAITAGVGSFIIMVCAFRLARGVPRLWRAVTRRRRHRQMLGLIARQDGEHADVLVLEHPVPVAYCLPSRRGSIVISTGAQNRLSTAQLQAVLAHERTHLRQRHHALLLLLDLAYVLLPWLPTVRRASVSLPLLLEMAADDVAAHRYGRPALAGALRKLTITPGPAGALAAAAPDEPTLTRRLARLDAPARELSRVVRTGAWTFFACALGLPFMAVTAAAIELTVLC